MYRVLNSITLGIFFEQKKGKGRTWRRTTGETDLEEPPATLCARSTISGDSGSQLFFTTGKLETL